jgi:hypothetical protein
MKSCDKSQFWRGRVIVLSMYYEQEHPTVQPTHAHCAHVTSPFIPCLWPLYYRGQTHVVQGSNTCTTCTCVGCTVGCSCPSYIDKTITLPPQNWLLSQLFLSTGSSPVISSHPRLHACIHASFWRRARPSLVDDHTITRIEIAVVECESRIKSDNSLVSHNPTSLLASQHIHRCRFRSST